MTSLFDHAVEMPPMGVVTDLVRRGGRDVSLLEFVALELEPDELEPARETAEERESRAAGERARQVATMVDAARETAERETRESMLVEHEAAVSDAWARVTAVERAFAEERGRYFAAAEGEVVRLALAVARKVLAREAAVDALHLIGIVRAALSRVQDGSESTLRVPVGSGAMWQGALVNVGVVEDEEMMDGAVKLETSVGCVELGVGAQMEEIARGFGV